MECSLPGCLLSYSNNMPWSLDTILTGIMLVRPVLEIEWEEVDKKDVGNLIGQKQLQGVFLSLERVGFLRIIVMQARRPAYARDQNA